MRVRPSLPGGVFAGHRPLPQTPDHAGAREFIGELTSTEPAVRATDTGRRTYRGAALTLQIFTYPADVNSEANLQMLPLSSHNARRALARTRGIPGL
jgi:hypothetical protein